MRGARIRRVELGIGSRRAATVFYYSKQNKYSIHALLGSAEVERPPVDVYLAEPLEPLSLARVLRDLAEKYELLVVAFSFFTTQLEGLLRTFRALERLREEGRAVLVAGGPHPSGDPLGTLDLGFDYVVVGEGEWALPALLEALAEGEDPAIPGVCYRSGAEIVYVPPSGYVDLEKYPPFPLKARMFNPIEVTRGCPFACRYCQTSYIHGKRPRHRSVECIVRYSELELRAGLRDLRFVSPNALGYGGSLEPNVGELEDLLRSLRRLADRYGGRVFLGSFPSEVRPDFVDTDLASLLKECVDNRRVVVGAQSGSDEVLRRIGRGHTVEDVEIAVEALSRAGFDVDVDFILGLPGEGEEELKETLKFMEELVKRGVRIHAHVFMPLPGTPFARAPPGKLPTWVKKALYRLIGRGSLFGQWEKQEKLAETIYRLRKRGLIKLEPLPTPRTCPSQSRKPRRSPGS